MSERSAWTRYVTGAPAILRANKYGATPTDIDGLRFDSKKEARRYTELRLLEMAGQIRDLVVHPWFPLYVVPLKKLNERGRSTIPLIEAGRYSADFRYINEAGAVVIEDVKSRATKTTAYRLRKRLVEAIYGITIIEV